MAQLPSLRDIFELLSGFKRALHPRELASRMEVSPEKYGELIAALDELEQEGSLKVLPGGRVRAVGRRANPKSLARQNERRQKKEESWKGDLSVHPKGFGFVTAPGHDDVFIPPDAIYEAMHGDQVVVRVTGKSRKGYEGCVSEVTERRSRRAAGVIEKKRKGAWLNPDDGRLRGPFVLTGDLSEAKDGDAAVVEIVRFPQFADELPEATLLEVLGPQGDPQTEVKKILLRESVREEHTPEALQNAEQMAHRLRAYRLGTRRDLRHIPLPTIDPEDARDHDDALWVERTRTGYRAYIAIADVSEYVRAESPLDEEARSRGCTIYLPDRAIPMLPRALAGDLCSLLPEQDRFCMCVIADLDKRGNTTKFEIVEGLMRSQAKLTYDGVARALGFDDESPQSPQADAMLPNLKVLAELTQKLRKNRMSRGALDLDLPESRVVLDEGTGAPIEVKKRATRPGLKRAYSLVEEMMLLANELVAKWLDEKKIPGIYRVHGKPDEAKLDRLANVVETLGLKLNVDGLTEPLGAAKFLQQIRGHERKAVLEMLLLRSLKQAVYDTENVGHFGLASERYVHFTSPIRRYPDLRVHRQIKQILRGGKINRSDDAKDDLKAASGESSKKERAAMEVEREVKNLYQAVFMKQHIGDEFKARVTGMSGAGLYLSIDEPCVDVMIQFDQLGPEEFEPDDQEIGVVGVRSGEHIMMGDEIELVIIDVGIERRTVYARRITGEEDDEARRYPARGRRDDKTFRNRRPVARRTRTPRVPTSASSRPGASSSTRRREDREGREGSEDRGRPGARSFKKSDSRDSASKGKAKSSSSRRSSATKGRAKSKAPSKRSGSIKKGSRHK